MKKRIFILCDGTWNDLEMRYITNVGRLAQILEPEGKSDGVPISQVVYYDDGVAATDATVHEGKYPYARTLRFYTNKARESEAAKEFLEFVLSPKGQEILHQLGYSTKP